MKKLILFLLLWPAFLLPAEAQRTLHGKISDAGGEFVKGAAIKVAGTETGFIADTDGRYEIRGVRFPARIIVSYIGYADTEIDLTGNEAVPYDIVLDDSKNILDEVVVVGFGTQKKSTLSGSVGIVDGATLNQRPVVSAANALQGGVKGIAPLFAFALCVEILVGSCVVGRFIVPVERVFIGRCFQGGVVVHLRVNTLGQLLYGQFYQLCL